MSRRMAVVASRVVNSGSRKSVPMIVHTVFVSTKRRAPEGDRSLAGDADHIDHAVDDQVDHRSDEQPVEQDPVTVLGRKFGPDRGGRHLDDSMR